MVSVPGDSGSWVILTNGFQLCGHIVAAKLTSPRAYMTSFREIVKGIESDMKAGHLDSSPFSVALKSTSDQRRASSPDALTSRNSAKDFQRLKLLVEEDPIIPHTGNGGHMLERFEYNLEHSEAYPQTLVRQTRPHHVLCRREHMEYLEQYETGLFSGPRSEIIFSENRTLRGQ